MKFLHSDDEGVVTSLLDNGMVNVLLDREDMEIPVFTEDLIRAEDAVGQPPRVKAKIVPGKKPKAVKAPERPAIESQYAILKSLGIQLAFEPVFRSDATTEHYRIHLINDTRAEVLFTFTYTIDGRPPDKSNGKLEAVSAAEVGEMLFDHLNDGPVCEIECWKLTTTGTGARLHKIIKLKPKQFFKRLRTAPILNRQVHLYRVFENLSASRRQEQQKQEDLRTYTKRKARPAAGWNQIRERLHHEILEYAEFVPEIDLHAEQLSKDPKKLSNAEILRLQLTHFDAFLDKALRVGVERIFVIHGLGKGRLRNEIATRLLQHPEVKSFKNEWHPRYGYGATEVIFG